MSTIQNLKNFIRHGKQARHGDPTTTVSPVNAHQQRYAPPPPQNYGISDPNVINHQPLQQGNVAGGNFSVAGGADNRNIAAQAGGAAAKAADHKHKKEAQGGSVERSKDLDPSVIERIVAEERESKGQLPKYPGLEKWTLVEKMGDGAFSNVYRAKDASGRGPEVAIKVVRKFEMSSSQVSMDDRSKEHSFIVAQPPPPFHTLPSLSLVSCPSAVQERHQHPVLLGRRPSSPGLQKATKGCGGGPNFPYMSTLSNALPLYHRATIHSMTVLTLVAESEHLEGSPDYATARPSKYCKAY